MSSPSRRELLGVVGTGLCLSVAGCAASSATARVSVSVVNLTDAPQSVAVELRRDRRTVWRQVADLPAKRPGDPGTVETERALTGVDDDTAFDVRVGLDDRPEVTTAPLVVDDVRSDPSKSVVVRIVEDGEDPRVEISSPR